MPCFSDMRMIKINSTQLLISDDKWPPPFNMSRAPLYFIIGFPRTIAFKRTFIESSSKQMDSHQKLNGCYNKNCSDPRSCLLFTSVFVSIPNFRLIKYRIAKCIPFNVADVAKKEFREER